jgi:hypothetical protein
MDNIKAYLIRRRYLCISLSRLGAKSSLNSFSGCCASQKRQFTIERKARIISVPRIAGLQIHGTLWESNVSIAFSYLADAIHGLTQGFQVVHYVVSMIGRYYDDHADPHIEDPVHLVFCHVALFLQE